MMWSPNVEESDFAGAFQALFGKFSIDCLIVNSFFAKEPWREQHVGAPLQSILCFVFLL